VNAGIGTEAALFPEMKYIMDIFPLQCNQYSVTIIKRTSPVTDPSRTGGIATTWTRFPGFSLRMQIVLANSSDYPETSVADPDPNPHSESTESTCFWASRIRIRILLLPCKNSKKNLDSYYFVTLFEFLSLKNDVNVASKSHKQKKLCSKK
jgi:hypothetical protein